LSAEADQGEARQCVVAPFARIREAPALPRETQAILHYCNFIAEPLAA